MLVSISLRSAPVRAHSPPFRSHHGPAFSSFLGAEVTAMLTRLLGSHRLFLPVFLLKDSEGTTPIYKNYTTAMDPTLTYEVLPKLDKRLKHLPAGFKFNTRTLDRDLVIKAVGRKGRIMWDELGGSWDALDPGVANYQPYTGYSLIFSIIRNWTLPAMM